MYTDDESTKYLLNGNGRFAPIIRNQPFVTQVSYSFRVS